MGTYFFSKGEHTFGDARDLDSWHAEENLSEAARRDLRAILALLDTELAAGDPLGFHVGDVEGPAKAARSRRG